MDVCVSGDKSIVKETDTVSMYNTCWNGWSENPLSDGRPQIGYDRWALPWRQSIAVTVKCFKASLDTRSVSAVELHANSAAASTSVFNFFMQTQEHGCLRERARGTRDVGGCHQEDEAAKYIVRLLGVVKEAKAVSRSTDRHCRHCECYSYLSLLLSLSIRPTSGSFVQAACLVSCHVSERREASREGENRFIEHRRHSKGKTNEGSQVSQGGPGLCNDDRLTAYDVMSLPLSVLHPGQAFQRADADDLVEVSDTETYTDEFSVFGSRLPLRL